MESKKNLAASLVSQFHSPEAGQLEKGQFEKVFSKGHIPDEMDVFQWEAIADQAELTLVELMHLSGKFQSKKEIRRLIEQGAVKINEERVSDPQHKLTQPVKSLVIQAGKRIFFKISGTTE